VAEGVSGRKDIVSVIIVNWNGLKFLTECLDGLRRQVYRSFSVIMVDNGSHDGSVAVIRDKYPEVDIISLSDNTGFAVANNIALRAIKTPYAALLNNDTVPDPLWLHHLQSVLETHPEAGFAASKMLFYDTPGIIDRAGDAYTKAGTALLRGRGHSSADCNDRAWVFGACAGAALYRTSMLRDIGLFDEDFFALYEDVDLSFRAQLKGYKCLYVPEAVVHHKGSSSIVHDSPTSVYYCHRNLEWVYLQNMPRGLIAKSILPHLIYDLVAFVYFVLRGRGADIVRAKRDALKGLGRALQKRKRIQAGRMVTDDYIRGLLDRPMLLQRFLGRLRKP